MAKEPKHIKQKQYCNTFNKDRKKKKKKRGWHYANAQLKELTSRVPLVVEVSVGSRLVSYTLPAAVVLTMCSCGSQALEDGVELKGVKKDSGSWCL